jgi:membrane-associated phospholipid phosphatase
MGSIIRRGNRAPGFFVYILLIFPVVLGAVNDSPASDPEPAATSVQSPSGGGESLSTALANDGSYLFHSLYSDGIDLLKLPLRVNEVTVKGVLVGTAILGTIPATIYGLDDPLRRNVKNIPDSTAGDLDTIGHATTFGTLGLIYGWGLYSHNDEARHAVLTGAEGVGLSSLLTLGIKAAFGRKRPKADEGPRAFFQGGQSFISGEATPSFAAAATISEAFNYHWWAAIPAYSLAVMTGVGRMGKDAHWASDILGSALVGAGTTELLFYLHRERENPTSLIILPMLPTQGGGGGITVGFNW